MTKAVWNKGSIDRFKEKAIAAHGERYDYSQSEYIDYHTKLKIICTEHGAFMQKPAHHCAGIGCPSCGKARAAEKLSQGVESYIALAKSIHGDLYDYSLLEYKNRHTKVKIICKEHGVWESSPHSHVSGDFCGCPKCALRGFDRDKTSFVYILGCGDITKVGITNRSPSIRAAEVSEAFGAEFTVIATFFFGRGAEAIALESRLLKDLAASYQRVKTKFDGSTECFIGVDRQALIKAVSTETEEYYV